MKRLPAPGSEAYEREVEARFAQLDYPPHLSRPALPQHDCGKACHCDHYDEPGPEDDPQERA